MAFGEIAKRTIAVGVTAQLLIATQLATMAQAEMISTDAVISGQVGSVSRAHLLEEIRRDETRAELVRRGVDPTEAEARLAALTDAEIQATLQQIEDDSAGAGVVGTLATIFIILLVTDILCLTRLFNFTRCVR